MISDEREWATLLPMGVVEEISPFGKLSHLDIEKPADTVCTYCSTSAWSTVSITSSDLVVIISGAKLGFHVSHLQACIQW